MKIEHTQYYLEEDWLEEFRYKKPKEYRSEEIKNRIDSFKEYFNKKNLEKKDKERQHRKGLNETDRYKAMRRNINHKRRLIIQQTDISTKYLIDLKQNTTHCEVCNKELKDNVHLDHIIPIHVGGTHTMSNVRYIHSTCNLQRAKNGSDLHCSNS